jgi:histidinol-phosphate aminotransferase
VLHLPVRRGPLGRDLLPVQSRESGLEQPVDELQALRLLAAFEQLLLDDRVNIERAGHLVGERNVGEVVDRVLAPRHLLAQALKASAKTLDDRWVGDGRLVGNDLHPGAEIAVTGRLLDDLDGVAPLDGDVHAPIRESSRQLREPGGTADARDTAVGGEHDDERAVLQHAVGDELAVAGLEDVEGEALTREDHQSQWEEPEVGRFVHRSLSSEHYTIIAIVDSRLPTGLIRPALDAVDPYEPGRPISAVRLETGVQSVVKLASNEGPFPPFPGALAAIAEAAAEQRLYPDPGAWELRDALERHTMVPAAHILAGNGVDSLIKLICLATLDPGDELVMGWPSFLSWRQGALMMGAAPILVPLAADGSYDLEAVLEAITPRTKLAVVVSPNNPTGGAVDAGDLARFVAAVPDHVLTVLDEAYFEFLPSGSHDGASLLRDGTRIAVTRTFSKAFGLAGMRVGYLMGPTELLTAIGRVRNVFDVNGVAQAAAKASLGEVDTHLPERIALNDAERARVAAALRDLDIKTPSSQANFLFIDLGSTERANACFERLLARGVIIRPARGFGAPTAVRVTIGLPEENDRFIATFGEVLAELPVAA